MGTSDVLLYAKWKVEVTTKKEKMVAILNKEGIQLQDRENEKLILR